MFCKAVTFEILDSRISVSLIVKSALFFHLVHGKYKRINENGGPRQLVA